MNNKDKIINISLVISSGVLFFLADLLIPFFIWFAFVPLIILSQRNGFKSNLIYAVFSAFIIALGVFYWSLNYKILYGFLLILYVASFFFFYEVLLNLFFSKIKNIFGIFVPAFVWVILFWIYPQFGFGSLWFNLAVFQVKFSFLNQFLGEFGFTFLIIFVNTLLVYAITKENKASYVIPIIFISLILFSAYYYGQHKETEGRRVRVATIQGSFSENIDWRKENAVDTILNDYIDLTRQAAKEKPDVVVWPEYAIPVDISPDKNTYKKISDLAKELKINLIVGTFTKGEELADTDLQYDSAFAFDREGKMIGRYDALKPFPIGSHTLAGEDYVILDTDSGRIAVTICFDEFFNNTYKEYSHLGADYFISLSNNAPMKSFLGMRYAKRFSELRASIYKKYFIRSTNTGFSEIIDPFGNVINQIPFREKSYMVSDIYIPALF